METWLLWTIIGVSLAVIVGVIVWLLLPSSDPSYLCGKTQYDPNTQQCIHDKVCDNANVCGSAGTKTCIDPDSDQCIDGKACGLDNVCQDSDGNPVCLDPTTQTCLNGIVCATDAVCDQDCIDIKKYHCVNGGKCLIDKVCGDNCCTASQRCGSGSSCIQCDTELCEGSRTCCDTTAGESCINDQCCVPCGDSQQCCPDDQQCITLADSTTVCCDPNQICLDSDGKQVCCTGSCCNGLCCDDSEVCVNGSCCPADNACDDGTCCDNECCGGQCCGDDTVCHNGVCMTACGDDFCDPVSQICDEVSTTGDKYCVDQGCIWQGMVYDPADLRDNTGAANIPVCGYDGKYYTCRDPTGVSADKLSRTVTDLQDPTSTANCTVSDCDYRFSEKGLVDVQWDSSQQSCTGTFDCDNELPVCGDCPVSGDDAPRCCTNSDGSYTGQLCPANTFCVDGKCYTGYNCTNGTCELTTDPSPQYGSYSACVDASCIAQPAKCYKDTVSAHGDSMTNPRKYLTVAVYGMTVQSYSSGGDISQNKLIKSKDPWWYQWKCDSGSHHQVVYVWATHNITGKTYKFTVYSGGSGSDCKFGNTPSLKEVSKCSSTSDTDCTSSASASDFSVYGIKGVDSTLVSQKYTGGVVPSLIIVPADIVGTSCISSETSFSLLPITPWNPAGVF